MEVAEYTPLIGFNGTFLMVLVSFGVLYFVVRKLFFEKVHNFMQAREQKVLDQFEDAENKEKEADAHLAEYSSKLENVESERRGILKDAKAVADKRASEIIKEAEEKAAGLLEQARKNIEREREEAALAMKDEVAMLAVFAAEQILKKKLDEKEGLAFVDEILKEDGAKEWIH